MIELVYDNAVVPLILERFPNAKIEDASDFIHEDRVEVTVLDSDRDEFCKLSMREGFYEVCLGFQLLMRSGEKADKEYIERLLAELKAEKAKVRS